MAYDEASTGSMHDLNAAVLTQQVEDGVTGLNRIVEGHDVLSNMQGVIEKNEEEGIDPTTAEMVAVTLESICTKLGITYPKRMPAMESFENSYTKKVATQVALEGIGSVLKVIYDGIVKAITYLLDVLKGLISGMLTQNQDGYYFIKALKKKAAEMEHEDVYKSATQSDPGIQHPALYDMFYVNKQGTTPETVIEVASNTMKNFKVMEDYSKLFESFVKGFKKTVTSINDDLENIARGNDVDVYKALESAFDNLDKQLSSFIRNKGVSVKERDLPKSVVMPDGSSGEIYALLPYSDGMVYAMVEVAVAGGNKNSILKRIEYSNQESHEPKTIPYPTENQSKEMIRLYEMYNEMAQKNLGRMSKEFSAALAELTMDVTNIRRMTETISVDASTEIMIRTMVAKLGELLMAVSNDYGNLFIKSMVEIRRTFTNLSLYLKLSLKN